MKLLLFFLAFVAAILASMVGQGGGIFYTPIPGAVGVGFHQAATTSLFLIMVLSLSASLNFRKAHEIDWGLGAVRAPRPGAGWRSSLPRCLRGSFVAAAGRASDGRPVFMIRPHRAKRIDQPARPGIFIWRRVHVGQPYSINLLLALPLMAVVGFVTGMIGIGGGVLEVLFMNILFLIPCRSQSDQAPSWSASRQPEAFSGGMPQLATGRADLAARRRGRVRRRSDRQPAPSVSGDSVRDGPWPVSLVAAAMIAMRAVLTIPHR